MAISSAGEFSLPDPFEWVHIRAGKVTLEEGAGTFSVPGFYISKYPVTIAQYECFMDDGGYQNEDYWTPAGWNWRQKNEITAPHEWMDEELEHFFRPDHPVMNVSWFEATAFCGWMSHRTGQTITLPTEQGWQRAAQGSTGHPYPWGAEFDPGRCNNILAGIAPGTTPVTAFPGGASQDGVFDMSGNVWEWTLTDHETAAVDEAGRADSYTLRGGAWWNDVTVLRVDCRNENAPQNRSPDVGFRIVWVI